MFSAKHFYRYPIKGVLRSAELFRRQSRSSSNQKFGLLELDPTSWEVGI